MWRTPIGNRVLRGSEATLFAMGALRLLPMLGETDYSPTTSAKAFYRLSRGQQLIVLNLVVEAMFRRSIETPQHTAANEACIAAVYDGVRGLLADEIHSDSPLQGGPVRHLIRRTMWRFSGDAAIPWVGEDDIDEWDCCIETLLDRILWDRDFEDDLTEVMESQDVELALKLMRITPEYFSSLPANLGEPMTALLEERIRAVCEAVI